MDDIDSRRNGDRLTDTCDAPVSNAISIESEMMMVVFNGSPKGGKSVTLPYVRFMQKVLPQGQLEIEHLVPRIKRIERDESVFGEIIEKVRAADGVLWAFPVYVCLVHGGHKRFIELIEERGAGDAFRGKYAAGLSTSIHFYDHIAHNYIQAVCDDLGMRYVGGFSADVSDLLTERGRTQLTQFAGEFYRAIETQSATARRFAPLTWRAADYLPGPGRQPVDTGGKRVVIVTDAEPHQHNLLRMVQRLRASLAGDVVTVNLRDLVIKGGCLGCLACGYGNHCAYEGKDGFTDFYRDQLMPADVIVFCGSLRDRYLSALWKTFFDRHFFMNHVPLLMGKQFAFLISGPLSQLPNLRQLMELFAQHQRSNLVGFVTDEDGDSASLDALLDGLAERLVRFSDMSYSQPPTFLGVGGRKLFRDAVYGRRRIAFMADHRAYRRLGFYDFPQKDYPTRIANAIVGTLMLSPRFRAGLKSQIKGRMIAPYQKLF
jgi:multimeric flavodoxin WrbA